MITGTTKSGEISKDIALAAQSKATVIILMGLSKLGEIVELYRSFGKKNLPVAIIQNGTLPDERLAIGTIDTIEEVAEQRHIGSPGVIVIGEVVRLHSKFVEQNVLENYLLN